MMLKKGQKAIVGCVPLAMALVMDYYQWPSKGRSHVYYKPDAITYSMDFSKCQPNWAAYSDHYNPEDTEEVNNLAQLLVTLGLAVDAKFNTEGTSAAMGHIKHTLCNNMRYSGKMSLLNTDEISESDLSSLLRSELDAKRPCIVSNGAHAFVCDGYKGDMFHFCFGWGGVCDGYYRIGLGATDSTHPDSQWLKYVLHGIEPEVSELKCEVEVKKAGTLMSVLTKEQRENAASLVIKGNLNSSDIRLLRHMSGATDTLFSSWRGGALRHLDLMDATIVSDKTPYYSMPAQGTWRRWESWQDVSYLGGRVHYGKTHQSTTSYDLTNMDEKQWRKFKNDIGSKQNGYYYTFIDGKHCMANYYCKKSTIGPLMFANCSSLNSIELPLSLKAIDDYAFLGCMSLQTIYIPQKVNKIGELPFAFCSSLENIEMSKKCHYSLDAITKDCSPILKEIKRY